MILPDQDEQFQHHAHQSCSVLYVVVLYLPALVREPNEGGIHVHKKRARVYERVSDQAICNS